MTEWHRLTVTDPDVDEANCLFDDGFPPCFRRSCKSSLWWPLTVHSFHPSGCFWYERFRNQPGHVRYSQEILRNRPPTNNHHGLGRDRLPVWRHRQKHLQTARMACILFDKAVRGLEEEGKDKGDIFDNDFQWRRPGEDHSVNLDNDLECLMLRGFTKHLKQARQGFGKDVCPMYASCMFAVWLVVIEAQATDDFLLIGP